MGGGLTYLFLFDDFTCVFKISVIKAFFYFVLIILHEGHQEKSHLVVRSGIETDLRTLLRF